MGKKVYVGNLEWSVGVDALKDYFKDAGEIVDAIVITDKYSGRSKGFGFVEYADEKMAEKAIEMFNGKDFNGRNIIVSEARAKEESDSPESGEEAPAPEPAEEAPIQPEPEE